MGDQNLFQWLSQNPSLMAAGSLLAPRQMGSLVNTLTMVDLYQRRQQEQQALQELMPFMLDPTSQLPSTMSPRAAALAAPLLAERRKQERSQRGFEEFRGAMTEPVPTGRQQLEQLPEVPVGGPAMVPGEPTDPFGSSNIFEGELGSKLRATRQQTVPDREKMFTREPITTGRVTDITRMPEPVEVARRLQSPEAAEWFRQMYADLPTREAEGSFAERRLQEWQGGLDAIAQLPPDQQDEARRRLSERFRPGAESPYDPVAQVEAEVARLDAEIQRMGEQIAQSGLPGPQQKAFGSLLSQAKGHLDQYKRFRNPKMLAEAQKIMGRLPDQLNDELNRVAILQGSEARLNQSRQEHAQRVKEFNERMARGDLQGAHEMVNATIDNLRALISQMERQLKDLKLQGSEYAPVLQRELDETRGWQRWWLEKQALLTRQQGTRAGGARPPTSGGPPSPPPATGPRKGRFITTPSGKEVEVLD